MAESAVMKRLVQSYAPRPVEEPEHIRTLRKRISAAGDQVLGIRLGLATFEERDLPSAQVLEHLMQDGLIQSFEFDGLVGSAWIYDRTIINTCVEAQTTGQLSKSPSNRDVITPLDASLTNALAEALVPGIDTGPNPAAEAGAVFETREEVLLCFSAPVLRFFDLQLDIERGTRKGRIQVVLPVPTTASQHDLGVGVTGPRLEKALGGANAVLDVELYRTKVSLKMLKSLEPGSTLPIPRSAAKEMRVLAGNGRRVAYGRLGMADGARAVKLVSDEEVEANQIRASGRAPLGGMSKASPMPAADSLANAGPPPIDATAAPIEPAAPALAGGLPPLDAPAGDAMAPMGGLPPLDGGDGGLPPLGGADGGLPSLGGAGDAPGLPDLPGLGGDGGGGLPPLAPMSMDLDLPTDGN